MDKIVSVRFEPAGKVVTGKSGEDLIALAQRGGLHVNASCGGSGTCGTCKVRILEGEVRGGEHPKLNKEQFENGYRLACTAKVVGDVTVEVPLASTVDHSAIDRVRKNKRGKTLTAADTREMVDGVRIEPTVFKVRVDLTPPSQEDVLPDMDRLVIALKRNLEIHPISVDFNVLKGLGPILRGSDWSVTATLVYLGDRYRLIQVESGDTSEENYAVVVDIGTTTLAAQLLDLRECKVVDCDDGCPDDCNTLAATSRYNPQISYGEDVISRILHGLKSEGLETLQKSVVDGINEMIDRLLKRSKVERERISHMIVAGNSTMTQLFLGLDPRSIREAPYVTAMSNIPAVRAVEVGVSLGAHAHIWCFPLVASWVGGDVVAGVLGTGMWQRDETTLFIDVGTNGEIVLGNKDWMVTTSCSAGPAFEGGGIQCGMRAAKGAIEEVAVDGESLEPTLEVIGNVAPRGICGSGLIGAASALLSSGLLAPNGRFNGDLSTPRLRDSDRGGKEYVLAWANEGAAGEDIVLSEPDIDNLMRTKAAIFAGCKVLMNSVGIDFSDVDKVIIAGGFGQALDLDHAITIGLLPPLPFERFLFVGNGALLGSKAVAFSRQMHSKANELAGLMTHLDLADNPGFMDEYMAAMFLPHTDSSAFEHLSQMRKQAI